jgi:hypothetical protein
MRRHILFSPDVDEVPHPPRLRSDFQCPEEDTQGSSLTGQGTGTGVTSTDHGSTSETTFICFYDHGAGRCSYAEVCLIVLIDG